jgi:glycosyltransferase involved in cell wall biosynthesis
VSPPVISIIIPSFQQAQFLPETLRSIFNQDYPALDVRVIDGGSKDGTTDILRAHADRLAYWVSEPDRGQTHAINKGLAGMTGDIWMYLNSDDLLAPGALTAVVHAFANPAVQWLSGTGEIVQQERVIDRVVPGPAQSIADYLRPWARRGRAIFPFSGACFLRRAVYARCGGFDESFHYSMDMEYYTRLALESGIEQTIVPTVLAQWRWHPASKTSNAGTSYGFLAEEVRIAERFAHVLPATEQRELRAELRQQRRWAMVGRAVYPRAGDTPSRVRLRLLAAACSAPGLLRFRPWLGALRRPESNHA